MFRIGGYTCNLVHSYWRSNQPFGLGLYDDTVFITEINDFQIMNVEK